MESLCLTELGVCSIECNPIHIAPNNAFQESRGCAVFIIHYTIFF